MNFLFTFLVAIFHVLFFILEHFLVHKPIGQKILSIKPEHVKVVSLWSSNQGFYNLILALGLILSLFKTESNSWQAIRLFILVMIAVVGIYGAMTVGKTIFFVQTLPATVALFFVLLQMAQPRINDITTDFSNPPEILNVKKYNTHFIDSQKKYYADIQPLNSELDSNQLLPKIIDFIKNNTNYKNITEKFDKKSIYAIEQTQLIRFIDDITIEVRDKESGSQIHMRSRSRVGQSDFGANAKRIRDLFNLLKSNEDFKVKN